MKRNKIVEVYSIINNLMVSGILRLFLVVISLYTLSQVYQCGILRFIAIAGCIWCFESWFYEYRLHKIEEELIDKIFKEDLGIDLSQDNLSSEIAPQGTIHSFQSNYPDTHNQGSEDKK